MCADSPAPLSSMWTDGTENQITNFALDSGNSTEYNGYRDRKVERHSKYINPLASLMSNIASDKCS